MGEKIKLGISSCLLGERVRYDGGHTLDRYLVDILGRYVEWVPVCPEVEYGLPVPREAMYLIGDPSDPRLVTRETGIDHTQGMLKWASKKLKELQKENLCGFIFKSKSPSSGMSGVKVYSDTGKVSAKGRGIFAGAFIKENPLIPVEDNDRMQDSEVRENFIERVFVFMRWKEFLNNKPSIRGLAEFHADHKYLIMSHSIKHLRELGRFVAGAKEYKLPVLFELYSQTLMEALKQQATINKNVNVLDHIMGYFKKNLSADEKKDLLKVIDQYHRGLIPRSLPVTLLKHYAEKYCEQYLMSQYYLNQHPIE